MLQLCLLDAHQCHHPNIEKNKKRNKNKTPNISVLTGVILSLISFQRKGKATFKILRPSVALPSGFLVS